MSDHSDNHSDTASEAGSFHNETHQRFIAAPPWLEEKPEEYEAELKKEVQTINHEDCHKELLNIANNLPTYFAARELHNAFELLCDHALQNLFDYVTGIEDNAAGKKFDGDQNPAYREEVIKSSWDVARRTGNRVIACYALLLNNKDAENYWPLLEATRKVYLNWGLFDLRWSNPEAQEEVLTRAKDLHKQLVKLQLALPPPVEMGEADNRTGFIG